MLYNIPKFIINKPKLKMNYFIFPHFNFGKLNIPAKVNPHKTINDDAIIPYRKN